MDIGEIRQKYPQYDDMSDKELADALHAKHYSDMPINEFYSKIGLTQAGPKHGAVVPEQSMGDEVLRQLGLTAKHTLAGLSSIPGMVGDAANATLNLPIRAINAATGSNIPTFGLASDELKRRLNSVFPQERTPTERVVGNASQMLAAAPVMGAGAINSGIEALAPLASNMAAQAGSALGGGLAGGVTKEVAPDSPWLQAGATLLGSLAGGGGVAVAQGMAKSKQAAAAIPTNEQIKSAASAAYDTADNAGVVIKPDAVKRLTSDIQGDLADFGMDATLHPRIMAVYNRLEAAGNENISLKGVDILRRVASNAAKSPDPSEQALASKIIDKIDEFIGNLGPDDVLQGNADEGIAALTRARGLWSTLRKSEMIDNAVNSAELKAASTNSGGNTQNAIRQALRAILDNPKKSRGFTGEEKQALEDIIRGTITQNTLRTIGRLAPSSNSWLGPLLGVGGYLGGGPAGGLGGMIAGQIIPAAGSAAKAGATALTNKSVDALSALIRSNAMRPAEDAISMAPPMPSIDPYTLSMIQQLILQNAKRPGYDPALPGLLSGAPLAASDTRDKRLLTPQ